MNNQKHKETREGLGEIMKNHKKGKMKSEKLITKNYGLLAIV